MQYDVAQRLLSMFVISISKVEYLLVALITDNIYEVRAFHLDSIRSSPLSFKSSYKLLLRKSY